MKAGGLGVAGVLWVSLVLADEPAGRHPVYGVSDDHLRFSHLGHEHTSCERCHPGVGELEHPSPALLPGHRACQGCHPGADQGKGKAPGCLGCHRGSPRREQRAVASLKFSHRLHAGVPESCMTCHVPELEAGPTGMLPQASVCAGCHASLVERRCEACHPAGPGGRLVLELPGGKLVPGGRHGGEDHHAGWKSRHGRVARQREESCRVCHSARNCDDCHRGVLRSFRIHPPDWELSHAGPARAGLQDCRSCHRTQSKCLSCHRETGVAESGERRPRNLRLHPEGYGAGRHAADARRNLLACTACHRETDCIRCHGAEGIGQGVSPHPPDFRRRCKLLQRRNPRPCLKCHMAADLEARCP